MGKETRTVGIELYQNVFLRLFDRVNAAGTFRDAITDEMRRMDVNPNEFKNHVEAIQDSDHSLDDVLEQAHSLDEFYEMSPATAVNRQEA